MLDNFRKLMDVLQTENIGRAKAEKTTTKLLAFVDGVLFVQASFHLVQFGDIAGEQMSAILQMYNIAFESIMSQTKNRNDGLWYILAELHRHDDKCWKV